MKTTAVLVLFLLFSVSLQAQNRRDKRKVKATIQKMFSIVEEGKSMELAKYIVYRGDDRDRKWKDYCRYENLQEKHQVQSIHQRIVDRYLPYDYKFIKFLSQKESEGEWLVWQLNFQTDKGLKEVYFAFLKVGDKYLLGDID